MIGVRVIEANDILSPLPPFPLNAHQLARIDVIAILRRVGTSIAAAHSRCDRTEISIHLTEQHSATFVRIGLLTVAADFLVRWLANLQHRDIQFPISNFRLFCKLAIGNWKSEISILLPKIPRSNTCRRNRKGWSQTPQL